MRPLVGSRRRLRGGDAVLALTSPVPWQDLVPALANETLDKTGRNQMNRTSLARLFMAFAASMAVASSAMAQGLPSPPPIMPPALPASYTLNLMTAEGAAALDAKWRISEVKIVERPAVAGLVTQSKITYTIEPMAGPAEFDDSKWQTIEPKDLSVRRGAGHVSFMWYRTGLTIPAKLGDFDPAGAVAVITVVVDDYAEVWVNGQLPRRLGRPSHSTIQGFNMPN